MNKEVKKIIIKALDEAESVLYIFEEKYPENNIQKKALELARKCLIDNINLKALKDFLKFNYSREGGINNTILWTVDLISDDYPSVSSSVYAILFAINAVINFNYYVYNPTDIYASYPEFSETVSIEIASDYALHSIKCSEKARRLDIVEKFKL